ncbi:hypothetical protein CesoFtcFv8_010819 [Champsocephalus esox]|uniref:Uncharacterized protein n=1 Tax=Champsocephalus esox TaxID=159716 RepID=A0AAN8GWJ2_9TELE|nr:hypothetical protein CesoFtcFv8_010819 [Champsocephalus esox]
MVLLALTSFCVLTRRTSRKTEKEKGGLVGGLEAEAHIWVIGVDRPWIIPPTTEPLIHGGVCTGRPNPMECTVSHSAVAARYNSIDRTAQLCDVLYTGLQDV